MTGGASMELIYTSTKGLLSPTPTICIGFKLSMSIILISDPSFI